MVHDGGGGGGVDEDSQEDEGGQGCEWGDSGKHPRHQSVINLDTETQQQKEMTFSFRRK